MCGRVVQKTPLGEIRVLFETVNLTPNSPSYFNAAPTQVLPVVRLDQQGRRSLDLLRWGLIPFWAKDATIGARCINAMSETVAEKPAFREAFRRGRRCLVPVDEFYEWQKTPRGKQPYLIGMADGSPLALTGLWETWKDPQAGGEVVQTFTVLTTEPNELCAPIHNRMPVILGRENWPAWLGEVDVPQDELLGMLRPYPARLMRAHPLDRRVGNVRNNDPDLLTGIADAA
jgi:putative SOS response-associated peptidase YedK